MSSSESTPIDPNTNPHAYLGFTALADGSVTRLPEFLPATAASSDPANPVLTKDVPINQETGTWARIYLPRPKSEATGPTTKLPVIIYYHGGGFVVCSAASLMFQKSCQNIVLELPAVMVSVEYRLAPEHRLPAAYDDGVEALHWVKDSKDEWLTKYGDLSNCYIMGTSAGANIGYHVGSRVVGSVGQLRPLKIRGFILHHLFFGGVKRTPSEIRLGNIDKVLPLPVTDLMWALALPVGADRDHEYCNSVKGVRVEILEKMRDEGWRFLVTGCDGDPLIDRQREFARILKENGVNVIEDFSEGGFHGIEIGIGIINKFLFSQL